MSPHNRIVTIPVKVFSGLNERCTGALRAVAGRLQAATSSTPAKEPSPPSVRDSGTSGTPSNRPAPTDEIGRDADDGPDREWICARCEDVYTSDPTSCLNCGFTVFEPDSRLGAGEEDTGVSDTSVSSDVVASVAAREGVQPAELPSPLYAAIDPEALDALVPTLTGDGTVIFEYLGYDVLVTGAGDVAVGSSDVAVGGGDVAVGGGNVPVGDGT